ncbi:protein kinase [Archangium violaceum]|uniref:protein kinase domain-containing protein n=1 Tax=Archangium violaceum TaxID=83451 RepID=UPI0019516DDD|nr:protein kinase [Archangium violaceum]QRN98820.1 protein kinase [Archangium violaceum]
MDSRPIGQAPAEPPAPLAPSLPAGTVIAGRFTLEALAGHGGMGTVYRATDARSGQRVALKLLHPSSDANAPRRFTREAEVLSALRHPGIVAHVAHGHSEQGLPFLAMQWLEGETLAQRLSHQPLRLHETLALLRRATEALAAAHQQGVIHRDLKPSNLFLRHAHPEDVVLLDFGLARHVQPSTAMTASQMLLGTPGYMAPEQVSGQGQLTPAADVFSLGCVLYECLTGRPPFSAPHLMAALAKILFTEPVPVRELCPQLPSAFQELLGRMLAKEPARRPPEASSLMNALEDLQTRLEAGPGAAVPQGTHPPCLTHAEQQLVTVMLAAPRATAGHAPGQQDSRLALRDSLRTLLAPQGARVELLADGALVLTLVASLGSATDPAALAARCALSLLERWPEAAVVLTTGRGTLDQHLPVGEAMNRAGLLLRQVESLPPDSTPVLLDEVTAGLLGPGFLLTRHDSGIFLLRGEQSGADESRPLLGKPTPCVGREQELALLDLTFTSCVEESTAQAVLVTAPAGAGKSRLRHEFLRRLERHQPPPLVLLGRGDPMSAGSADGLLAQALRRLCGLCGGEPLEVRRGRLLQRLGQQLPAAQAREVAEFLGELCGIPFSDEHSPRLRAARGDPRLMSAQVGRALVSFLQAECARHPVLLVLEDLHWGDLLTLRLMDEALRELSEQPFMVLALARPEVDQLLASSLSSRRLQPMPLRGLSRKAGARLVREVLGADVPDSVIHQLVEQAAGNALFLEELIRGVAEGRGGSAPETVLAMLQARLMRLEPEARRVLLAASIYGRTFWSSGVRALLGDKRTPEELDGQLRQLVELEWVEPQQDSRFPGEAEYRFRHALVRDAAHGLVADNHKRFGHQVAGAWLENAGERDPRVLAEHAALGQQPERAIPLYTRAAEQLFERHDMQGMERCMEAALGLGPGEEARVRLHALRATAAFWMDDFATLHEVGSAVLPRLKPGEARWSHLISGLCLGYGQSGQKEHLLALHRRLLDTEPEPEARGAYHLALCFMGCMTCYVGAIAEADESFERLERTGSELITRDAIVRGWGCVIHGFRTLCLTGGPWQALTWTGKACQSFREVGSERDEVAALSWESQVLLALGDVEGAMALGRRSMEVATRVGQLFGITHARHNLMQVLAASPEPAHQEEARALALEWVEARIPNRVHLGSALLVLARLMAEEDAVTEAEAQARLACETLAPFGPFVALARWLLGTILLAQGRPAEARHGLELALRELKAIGDEGIAKVGLLQVLAESCFAEGATAEGEEALRGALRCVRARASDIPDAAVRECFLRRVPENARVLELARQRWGETLDP